MAAVKDVLEGKPLRCPIHPALVHLPIALFPISLLLDVASWIWPNADLQLVRGAFIALIGGLVSGLLAAVFGFIDYAAIRIDHRAKKTAKLHMVLNIIAIVLFAISAVLHRDQLDEVRTGLAAILVSLAGLGLLGYSGYIGGHLVYSDGVAAGRHRRDTPAPHSTITATAATVPWIQVGDERSLIEGGTLRLDLDGTIVVIARVKGNVYAFQEFCTHRYGPLSEGALEGTDVICPWHCSKFDVRNGKVTAGPAKVDLRTFRVEEREGKIWIEAPDKQGSGS
jgi:nitrite reductase/ring-hydroxylating ferredoxin subunit/uncharacterized membrane protein